MCSALKIERRTGGASLTIRSGEPQLPHLFRANYACESSAVRLGECLKTYEDPVAPTAIPHYADKAHSGEANSKLNWKLYKAATFLHYP